MNACMHKQAHAGGGATESNDKNQEQKGKKTII